jgi:serine/threonine protein kinase/tetratricopeptide (TPR) repeat protein
MDDRSSVFGVDPGRIDRLLAWPLSGDAAVVPAAGLEQFAEGPGAQIGRYKLLRLLGEGGMGVVYLAEQQEPVRREVALKIIKPGMDSKRVLARFEVEQQTLARLEHPHIARVYDAGLAPSGRPYFVMEYVKGLPITQHCDEHRLTIEERLHLFLHVCEAVQHAHQKGILHRDLKPSNILVEIQDHETIPKVIDFGVARTISQPLTEQTLYTEQGQLIGTPEYMSPEQAGLGDQDIDTRTDVYSLGVVLYELLAGVLPFDPQTFRTGGMEHIRQVICEEEPKTPSTRLSKTSAEESSRLAQHRQADVRTLRRKLHGDLDWITLKALEKDRTRRYATVDALAADLGRYLNHQPVSAAPPGTLYRTRKFARRHRQALAVASAATVLLFVLLWAARAHIQAGRERTRAEALEYRQILEKARNLFNVRGTQAQGPVDPSNDALALLEPLLASKYVGPEAQLLFATILAEHRYYDEAVPRLEKLLNEPPDIAGAAYALLARIAWESPSLGRAELRRADEYQKKAEELLPRTAEAYYLRAMAALTIREKLDLLAEALRLDRNHYPSRRLRALIYQASRKYEFLDDDALVMTDRWPGDPLGHSLRAIARTELGKYQDAIKSYDNAIELTAPDDPQYIKLNEQRGGVLLRTGQHERVLAGAEECLKHAPDAVVVHSEVFCALTALGRYEEASALYQRIAQSHPAAGAQLRAASMKHVFDTLDAGSAWHPADSEPKGKAFLCMFEAEETYRNLVTKAHRAIVDSFSGRWSPDGVKIAFALGLPGNSGLAICDTATRETTLLIVPGKDPSWSPDGRHIAFVRDYEVLRLSELATRERRPNNYMYLRGEEVWVMNADGTQPRRLARGAGFPSWSRDAKQVYYHSRMEHMLYSISVEDPQAKPMPVFACLPYYPAPSPDGNCVAYVYQEGTAERGGVRNGVWTVTNLASQSCIAEWAAPVVMWGGCWSPDGREFSLGGSNEGTASTGLWIYDLDKKEAAKVLSGPIVDAPWSPNKAQMLIRLGEPYFEIWMADLDPRLSTAEALGPAQTLEEHCRGCIATCDRQLEADPNQFISHLERTASALWIDHERAPFYLRELDNVLDRLPLQATRYYVNAQWILVCPSLRERLLPLALVLARAAARDAACARDLAHMLGHVGQREEAIRLWPAAAAAVPKGSCRYDAGSDTYTVVGAGADLWGTLDDLHFAGKKLTGDGSISARIDSVENVNDWTKAGIMIRSAVEPDCPNALLVVTPNGRLYLRHRLAENGISFSIDMPPNTIQLPHWLRLVRQGNHLTALHSRDGVTWDDALFGPEKQSVIQIPMEETVYIGLAVNSRDLKKTAEARISHVTTTGNVSPSGPFAESQDIRFQLPPSLAPAHGNK